MRLRFDGAGFEGPGFDGAGGARALGVDSELYGVLAAAVYVQGARQSEWAATASQQSTIRPSTARHKNISSTAARGLGSQSSLQGGVAVYILVSRVASFLRRGLHSVGSSVRRHPDGDGRMMTRGCCRWVLYNLGNRESISPQYPVTVPATFSPTGLLPQEAGGLWTRIVAERNRFRQNDKYVVQRVRLI